MTDTTARDFMKKAYSDTGLTVGDAPPGIFKLEAIRHPLTKIDVADAVTAGMLAANDIIKSRA